MADVIELIDGWYLASVTAFYNHRPGKGTRYEVKDKAVNLSISANAPLSDHSNAF